MTMLRWGFVLVTRLMKGGLLAMNTLSIAWLSTSKPTSSFTLPRLSGRGLFCNRKRNIGNGRQWRATRFLPSDVPRAIGPQAGANVHVMLSVELGLGTTDEEKRDFYERMRELGWNQLLLTTTFRARFEESATRIGAIATARGDLRKATQGAGIRNFQAAVHAGAEPPSVWDQAHL